MLFLTHQGRKNISIVSLTLRLGSQLLFFLYFHITMNSYVVKTFEPVIHKIATKHTFQHIISMLPSFAFFFLPNVVTLSRKDSSFLSFFSVDIVFDGEAISNSWLISLRAKQLKLAVQFRPRRDWNYRLTKMGVADYVCLHSPHPGSVHLDSF